MVTVLVVSAGAAVLAFGQSYPISPTTFQSRGTLYGPADAPSTLDEAHALGFVITLVTRQPWMGEDAYAYNLTLDATLGSGIQKIQIGTIAAFLAKQYVPSPTYIYGDIESANETAPGHWIASGPNPHLLYYASDGTPLYLIFEVALNVYYDDGSIFSGGWTSPVASPALRIVPDYVLAGQAILYTGGSLCGVACLVAATLRLAKSRPSPR